MQTTYEKSLTEVYKTVEMLEYEEYNKISKSFLENIYKNMDKDYYLNLIVDNEFIDNKMSEKAKEILALIYRDYLVTAEEREQLIEKEQQEETRIEQELREKYNPDNLFKNKETKIETTNNSIAMVEYKESIFIKIKNWFKRIFK